MAVEKTSFLKPCPIELYLPESRGPSPLICLTPILGRLGFLEDLFIERRFAGFFAKHGFATAVIDRPIFEFNFQKGLEQIQDYLEESVTRSKEALDFLVSQERVNPQAIGSFGISFGSVINVLWAARDKRLKAHVFALTGGNIPQIIISSRDPLMRSYLKAIKKGWRGKNLAGDLERALTLDPLEVASSIPTESVLMLLGIFDRVIPLKYGLALREALRRPKTIFVPLGHYLMLLASFFLKWKALEFFEERFGRGGRSAGLPRRLMERMIFS